MSNVRCQISVVGCQITNVKCQMIIVACHISPITIKCQMSWHINVKCQGISMSKVKRHGNGISISNVKCQMLYIKYHTHNANSEDLLRSQ